MTRAEIQLNSITKEIEKLENRIKRETDRNNTRIQKAKELGVYFSTFEEWVSVRDDGNTLSSWSEKQYQALYIVGSNDRELNDLIKSLERCYSKLAKAEQVVNTQIRSLNEIRNNKIPKIEEFLDEWETNAIKYYEEHLEENVTKSMIHDERIRKSDYISYQVTSRIGKIVDAGFLTIGTDGNINGLVKGENGSVHIRTIIAGGYNIQCRHFRVLFS